MSPGPAPAVAVLAVLAGLPVTPARAAVPRGPEWPPRPAYGTVLLRWDGAHEDLVIDTPSTLGSDASGTLLVATPAPATVRAGTADPLIAMEATAAPEFRYPANWWPLPLFRPCVEIEPAGAAPARPARGPAAGPGVRRRPRHAGPFRVVTPGGHRARDMVARITAAGARPPRGATAWLRPYARRGWWLTAVTIPTTSATDATVTLRFATRRPVLPPRLTRHVPVSDGQAVRLLAAHRMRPLGGGFTTTYAGRFGPQAFAPGDFVTDRVGRLLAGGTTYLTALHAPRVPAGAVAFARAPDRAYRQVETFPQPFYIFGVAAGPLLVAVGGAVGAGVVAVRRRRVRADR